MSAVVLRFEWPKSFCANFRLPVSALTKLPAECRNFELQLDPACTFADEFRAIAWSTRLPQRLSLALRCGDNLVILSSFPLHADEQVNLRRDAQPSLQGAMDGGGFKKHGGWQNQPAGGAEVLVQQLVRRGDSGQELGFYHAFMIGRRYVSIFALGPEANRRELSPAAATLAPTSWLLSYDVNKGRSAMNLSQWGAYPVEKRNDLVKEICKEVSDGEMPGSAYTLFHPVARLTDADVQTVCR